MIKARRAFSVSRTSLLKSRKAFDRKPPRLISPSQFSFELRFTVLSRESGLHILARRSILFVSCRVVTLRGQGVRSCALHIAHSECQRATECHIVLPAISIDRSR